MKQFSRSKARLIDPTKRKLLTVGPIALLATACSSGARGSIPGPGLARNADAEQRLTLAAQDSSGSVIPPLTPLAELVAAESSEVHVSYAPTVPPAASRPDQRVFAVDLEVLESVCPLDPANGVETEMWGYRIAGDNDVDCGTPGPVLRGRVGDLARISLTNPEGNQEPHNIDFHAVTGQGGGAADLTVAPGETATIEARLLYPGAFMYHCAFGDVPKHIAHGMYGMFIVDPEDGLPEVDHEWSIMQSEWYVGAADSGGRAEFDPDAIREENPRYVTFNGRTDALTGDNALRMKVGERARFYMVNEGLNLDSNFHAIGSHWDTVYPEAAIHPVNRTIRGSQSTLVVAGGGTVTELIGQVPSTLILVDHALIRTFYKGAIGQVVIDGAENPEIFGAGASGSGAAAAAAEPGETAAGTVIIPAGAFDPANADIAYSPKAITVPVGTVVTWENQDAIVHTVTAGESDGATGTADGRFESGDIAAGESWSYTFDEAGTFPYFCTPHPWMIGSVVVEG